MHRTPQNRRGCIIFDIQTLCWFKNFWPKTFWHEIATQGHSFCTQLPADNLQGVAYRHHNIVWRFRRRSHPNRQKLPSSTTPDVVWRPGQDELPWISIWTLYFQKLESLAYIFAADSAVGSKTRIFSATECILAVQGHPRSIILVPIEGAYVTFY